MVRHLIAGCPQCTELIRRAATGSGLWTQGGQTQEEDYEEALQRAFFPVPVEEQPDAPETYFAVRWVTLETLAQNPLLAILFLLEFAPEVHLGPGH